MECNVNLLNSRVHTKVASGRSAYLPSLSSNRADVTEKLPNEKCQWYFIGYLFILKLIFRQMYKTTSTNVAVNHRCDTISKKWRIARSVIVVEAYTGQCNECMWKIFKRKSEKKKSWNMQSVGQSGTTCTSNNYQKVERNVELSRDRISNVERVTTMWMRFVSFSDRWI